MRAFGLLLAAAALSGAFACQGYRAGSFTARPYGSFEGQRRTVGCLDVAVTPTRDQEAYGPVAGLTIANRCDVGVTVDIGAIRASGRYPDGTATRLHAYDPGFEIRPGMLEARSVAREQIEYLPNDSAEVLFAEWCLDLARLDRTRPSDRPVLVCFSNGVRA